MALFYGPKLGEGGESGGNSEIDTLKKKLNKKLEPYFYEHFFFESGLNTLYDTIDSNVSLHKFPDLVAHEYKKRMLEVINESIDNSLGFIKPDTTEEMKKMWLKEARNSISVGEWHSFVCQELLGPLGQKAEDLAQKNTNLQAKNNTLEMENQRLKQQLESKNL